MKRGLILEPDIRSWYEFYREDEGVEPEIRLERIVCPQCRGQGTSTAYLGDVTEWLAEDPDAIEDYLGGVYDRQCETCHGNNVIDSIVETGSNPDHWASLMGWLRDAAEDRHVSEMERRMGA